MLLEWTPKRPDLTESHDAHSTLLAFSHPDYTVGPGTPPGPATLTIRVARGLYRRSGIGK